MPKAVGQDILLLVATGLLHTAAFWGAQRLAVVLMQTPKGRWSSAAVLSPCLVFSYQESVSVLNLFTRIR